MQATSSKALAALALSVLSLGAFASTYNGECTDQPKSKWMSTADVKARFEAQGYSVGRVKTGGSCYEVYAKDKGGQKVELFVNPVDASVVGQAGKK
ncbi:MAG: PepSY domain-containing protein [Proteobacteria bacterium]|nr:PepSY domain-containing protein [Pseudomonadota bacterium]